MDWKLLAGSIAAILFVAWIVRLMGLGQRRLESEAEAISLSADLIPGFEGVSSLLSANGAAALVMDQEGRIALIKSHGAQFAGRLIARPVPARQQGDQWIVDSGDYFFGTVRFNLDKQGADRLLTMM
ncbi:MAG: hypothetical protein R3E02_08175 [Blastomonas sp.]